MLFYMSFKRGQTFSFPFLSEEALLGEEDSVAVAVEPRRVANGLEPSGGWSKHERSSCSFLTQSIDSILALGRLSFK